MKSDASLFRVLYNYRELLRVLVWKNVALRYKQSYLGFTWLVLRPLILVGVFTIVREFVGIDSGPVPYVLLTYCAMVPWSFFQEASSDGVGSVVNNAGLIRKIYFPRELFPLAALLTKAVDLAISICILALMMIWFGFVPGITILVAPLVLLYVVTTVLCVSLLGSALNVYSRDLAQAVPLLLSLLMYLSPVMYPLELVRKKLLVARAAGDWSETLYFLYTLNPITGAIDAFQKTVLLNTLPDFRDIVPGMLVVALFLPISFIYFKRAETYFADVI